MATPLSVQPVPKHERLLLTAQDAAEMLSVPPESLAKLPILRCAIPGIKGVRYRRMDLEAYVRELPQKV